MTAPGHTSRAEAPTTLPITLPHTASQRLQVAQISDAQLLEELVAKTPRVKALHRIFQGRAVLRRVVFVVGYESLSVLFTVVVLSGLLGHGGGNSTVTAILLSTVATGWNYIWNTVFEAIERRRGVSGRGALARAIHAVGYEGGVLVFTIPLVAFMLQVGLLEAVMIESGLLVFFLIFTVTYTWVFDKVFGLPDSARADS